VPPEAEVVLVVSSALPAATSVALAAASAACAAGAASWAPARKMSVPATPGVAKRNWSLDMEYSAELKFAQHACGGALRETGNEAQFRRKEVRGCGESAGRCPQYRNPVGVWE
jgi:hypothetical protein